MAAESGSHVWSTMVGKMAVMAATGVVLVGFVVGDMLGNLKIFLGPTRVDRGRAEGWRPNSASPRPRRCCRVAFGGS